MTIPKCDKCGCMDFCVVRCKTVDFENASTYFGRSKSWQERELHGTSKYKAMCKVCDEIYEWKENHDLPVLD